MPRHTPRRWRAALLAPLVLALGACAENAPLDTLEPKGPEAQTIDNLAMPVFAIAGVVFVLVQFGVLAIVWHYRKRQDDDGSLPEQVHGNTKLELGWTFIPAILLAGVGAASVLTILDLDDRPADAQDLVIPAGEPVTLTITSRDVIHSFWIPALNGKRDAVPGREHPLLIQADEPGVYRGQCTEFCGLSHGYMQMRVVALSEADYAAWEENQLEGAQIPEDELAAEGMDTFRTACSQCHLVEGPGGNEEQFEAAGGVALVSGAAPNLTHFASRGVFAGAIFDLWVDTDGNGEVDVDEIGGTLNRPDLIAWLRNPPGEKPMAADEGRGMPNLELTDEQITALIAYLETLE